jgi:hypothetical protein
MAGLVPAIRTGTGIARDGRDTPGHDGEHPAIVEGHIVVCMSASTLIAWPLMVAPNGLAR